MTLATEVVIVREETPVVVPLVLIGGIVTFITTLMFLGMLAFVWAIVASTAAGSIAAPLFWLARRRDVYGVAWCGVLGAIAGVISVAFAWAVDRAIYRSLEIDLALVGIAAIIGAATGAIYGTVFDVDNLPPGTVRWRTMLILLVAIVLEFGLAFFI